MRQLVIDIETRPLLAYTFALRDQNIGINQIKERDGMLSFASRWHGERKTEFCAAWEVGEKRLITRAAELLDEADVVIGWNSKRFDVRWIQAQLARVGRKRVSPFTNVDLMLSARRFFKLPSYKLDYVAQFLGVGRKVKTGGFDLWAEVMDGDPAARRRMRAYNIGDTTITDAVYTRLLALGWVHGLPNAAIDGGHVCTTCGGENLQARGYRHTLTRSYRAWCCKDCGSWSQSTDCEPGSARLKAIA